MTNQPTRKSNRLPDYDYSQNGAYFITVCTKDMKCVLSRIVADKTVGDDDLGVPYEYGIKICYGIKEIYLKANR
jgi:hypothetical protein